MAERSTATTTSEGTPVTMSTSLTSSTIVPVPNPLMEPKSWMELGGFIVAIYAVFAIIEKRAKDRRKEDADVHKLTHDAVNRDIADIKHDLKNNESAVMAVANNRNEDVQRIVALELGQRNIEKAMDRIESNMEKNHRETLDTMKGWIDQMTDSIREVRDVKPR